MPDQLKLDVFVAPHAGQRGTGRTRWPDVVSHEQHSYSRRASEAVLVDTLVTNDQVRLDRGTGSRDSTST
jgi:hypothetical protein